MKYYQRLTKERFPTYKLHPAQSDDAGWKIRYEEILARMEFEETEWKATPLEISHNKRTKDVRKKDRKEHKKNKKRNGKDGSEKKEKKEAKKAKEVDYDTIEHYSGFGKFHSVDFDLATFMRLFHYGVYLDMIPQNYIHKFFTSFLKLSAPIYDAESLREIDVKFTKSDGTPNILGSIFSSELKRLQKTRLLNNNTKPYSYLDVWTCIKERIKYRESTNLAYADDNLAALTTEYFKFKRLNKIPSKSTSVLYVDGIRSVKIAQTTCKHYIACRKYEIMIDSFMERFSRITQWRNIVDRENAFQSLKLEWLYAGFTLL